MRKKIIIGVCVLLVFLSGISMYMLKPTKKNQNNNKVEEWSYSVVWRGLTYTGDYSGKIKNGLPEGLGEFRGTAYINDEVYESIIYNGKWENGKFEGKGELEVASTQIKYKGKYKEGCLNGTIRQYSEENSDYSKVIYQMDVPIGVSFQYNKDDNIIDYDYYFLGMSGKELCYNAEDIPYVDLVYDNRTYQNKSIKLQCEVVDKYLMMDVDEAAVGNWYVRAVDKNKHSYILRYSFNRRNNTMTYMPELEIGQKIEVYGLYSGLDNYDSELEKIPVVDALYVEGSEKQIFENNVLRMTYDNFVNYPHFYWNREIDISGTVYAVYNITKSYIYFIVESEDYSDNGKKLYLCYVKNNKANIQILTKDAAEIELQGKLKLIETLNINNEEKNSDMTEDWKNFPYIKIDKIIMK